MLRLSRRLGPVGRCRCFGALQIRGQGRAAHVFFLRAFGADRRQVRWIFNASRRSFEQRVLVDRQRPMKNIALDRPTVLQLDADGTDGALDAAADCDVLRNDAALDLCAIASFSYKRTKLALMSRQSSRVGSYDTLRRVTWAACAMPPSITDKVTLVTTLYAIALLTASALPRHRHENRGRCRSAPRTRRE